MKIDVIRQTHIFRVVAENYRLVRVTAVIVAWVNSLRPDCKDSGLLGGPSPRTKVLSITLVPLLWKEYYECCTPRSLWAINEWTSPLFSCETRVIIGDCSQYRCTGLSHAQMTVIWSRRNTGLSGGRRLVLFSREDGCSLSLEAFHYNSLQSLHLRQTHCATWDVLQWITSSAWLR